ncbi:MAG: hypothetical protein JWP97_6087 [Labilithrix sp.]|nr:hypothetical protein [Labilithrix sp.]
MIVGMGSVLSRAASRPAMIAVGAALLGSVTAFACSSFSEADAPVMAADAGPDGAAPEAATDVDASTGACNAQGVCELARGEIEADEIAADDDHVLWTTARVAVGLVRRVDITGGRPAGAPVSMAGPIDAPHSLRLYGPTYYFASGNGVHFGAIAAAPDAGTRPAIPTNDMQVGAVLRMPDTLAILRGAVLAYCPVGGGELGCGGGKLTEKTLPSTGTILIAEPGGLGAWYATTDGITRAQKTDFQPTLTWTVPGVTSLAIDPMRVYFTTVSSHEVRSKGLTLVDQAPSSVVTTAPGIPRALAVDAQHVYFAVADANAVLRAPRASVTGGAPEVVLDKVVAPRGLALNATHVFVTLGDGRVLSLPKPP